MKTTQTLDLDWVRRQFPALATEEVFFDNAGGSQVYAGVADRIRDYLLTTPVQLGASYARSEHATARVLAARRAIAEFIHAPHDEAVVMGGSTTSLLFQLTTALKPNLRPGDEIIVTDTDHESNIGNWRRLSEAGAVIKTWRVNREALELDPAGLETLLTPRTRWVAMTHASNVLGTINDVRAVADRVHAAGARLAVDGVAYAPHRMPDVAASGADVYVFSFYKVFGPHYAVMAVERELLLSLPGLNHYFIAPDDIPYKLQPGNVNFELSHGAAGIPDYLDAVADHHGIEGSARERREGAFKLFARQEDALSTRLLDYLRGKRGVRIIGHDRVTSGKRVSTVAFVKPGTPSESIVRHVDRANIGIRFGDFYAAHLIDALALRELGGVVRVSMLHYNTVAELDRLIASLEGVL
ncbi:MAG: cysteine desulfurase-like protein [Betaproteobacteria bacterium]|nr:cysteine desulfurase-like protein [Betaproteobacteria bacterium]